MKKYAIAIIITLSLVFLALFNFTYNPAAVAKESDTTSYYREKAIHSRDGIGKFYLGREIAHVMGHQAMLWLERPSRETEEQPQELLVALDLQPQDVVADIGAGTGYMSFRMANLVPEGKVFAVDIQPEMLDALDFLKQENNVTNVETILGTEKNPQLPEDSINLALMVDAYHEFEYPREMMLGIVRSLKPGGKAVLVEYRQENPLIAIKPLHKMSQKQVKKEMKTVGLTWQETKELLPQQHIMIFTK